MRIEIETMIAEITRIPPPNTPLEDVKKDIQARITSIIDSLKVDLSQAKNDNIRKWQNGALPLIHRYLTELTENPNIEKARSIFKKALQTNQKGAQALGINLDQLEKGESNTIRFFKEAITSDAGH